MHDTANMKNNPGQFGKNSAVPVKNGLGKIFAGKEIENLELMTSPFVLKIIGRYSEDFKVAKKAIDELDSQGEMEPIESIAQFGQPKASLYALEVLERRGEYARVATAVFGTNDREIARMAINILIRDGRVEELKNIGRAAFHKMTKDKAIAGLTELFEKIIAEKDYEALEQIAKSKIDDLKTAKAKLKNGNESICPNETAVEIGEARKKEIEAAIDGGEKKDIRDAIAAMGTEELRYCVKYCISKSAMDLLGDAIAHLRSEEAKSLAIGYEEETILGALKKHDVAQLSSIANGISNEIRDEIMPK